MLSTLGPNNPKYLIVGEFPSASDREEGKPFSGGSGHELLKMLQEAGIKLKDCAFTYVVCDTDKLYKIDDLVYSSAKKGKDANGLLIDGKWVSDKVNHGRHKLTELVATLNPERIIALGDLALWATTGNWGITKWRGSHLTFGGHGVLEIDVLPTYSPRKVMRMWKWRWICVQDLIRAAKPWNKPQYNFLIQPTLQEALSALQKLTLKVKHNRVPCAVDIETRSGQIACIGFCYEKNSAFCIPILSASNPGGYWTQSQELEIVEKIKYLLEYPNFQAIGQNYMYDMQYLARLWGIKPHCSEDTMIKFHTMFPGVSKGLDFLSSMFCDYHEYWKDESKNWDPRLGERQLWTYNCKDAVVTFEVNSELDPLLKQFNKTEQYRFQMRTAESALRMILRGVNTDVELKKQNSIALGKTLDEIRSTLDYITAPFTVFGPKGVSSLKVKKLAYDIFKLPKKYKRIGPAVRLTADKKAVEDWAHTIEPLYRPIMQLIVDFRSLSVYKSTFADSSLDHDGRFRCSINIAGPNTFRWSTSEDAFGFGTNLQNIPANQRKK